MGASVGNRYQCSQGGTLKGDECVVTTPARLLGDVNGDSVINDADAGKIYNFLNNENSEIGDVFSFAAADINGDAAITIEDYNLLYNSLNGISGESSVGISSSINVLLDEKYVCSSDTIMEGNNCVYKYRATAIDDNDSSVGGSYSYRTPKLVEVVNTVSWGQVLIFGGDIYKYDRLKAVYRIYVKDSNGKWKALSDQSYVDQAEDDALIHIYREPQIFYNRKAKKGKTYSYTIRVVSADGKKFLSDYDHKGITKKYTSSNSLSISDITNEDCYQNVKIAIKGDNAVGYENYDGLILNYKCGSSNWKSVNISSYKKNNKPKSITYKNYRLSNENECMYNARFYMNLHDMTYGDNGIDLLVANTNNRAKTYYSAPHFNVVSYNGSKKQVKLGWKKIKGVYEYAIFEKINGKWKTIKVTTADSYTFKETKKGTHLYTIRCRDKQHHNLSVYYRNGWSVKI